MSLGEFVSDAWHRFQGELFPFLADGVGPLGRTHRRFVAVLDLAPVERHLHYDHRGVGHPPADRNAKGCKESWRGYKLHIDAADGDIPVSRVLTSASPHDSQAAIPLARMTGERVDHRYELMDAACDSREIGAHARMAGRVAIIDANPRRDAALGERLAGEALAQRRAGHVRHDRVRHRRRSSVERVNSALKDSYGGRHVRVRGHAKVAMTPTPPANERPYVRVRGHAKVACHLMFGVLALTVDRLMRLTI